MKTYHLYSDYVGRYAQDLFPRVRVAFSAGGKRVPPDFWLCLGSSGVFATKALFGAITNTPGNAAEERLGGDGQPLANWLRQDLKIAVIQFDRQAGTMTVPESSMTKVSDLKGRRVLLADSHVNTGVTMLQAVEWLRDIGCMEVSTYAVAVRPTAAIIPNYFSILVGAHDRILVPETGIDIYPEDQLANHRMEATEGTFRRLSLRDLQREKVQSGVPSLDRSSWSDYWYDLCTDPSRHVVVYEVGDDILGFISYHIVPLGDAVIDEVAVGEAARGKGVASSLLRWVETHARAQQCSYISLWAIDKEKVKDLYRSMLYEPTGRTIDLGPDGPYFEMSRPVVPGMRRK